MGILVLDLKDDVYNFLPENKQPEGKALAIDNSNNITWFSDEEDFYFYITDNQILIHQSENIGVLYSAGTAKGRIAGIIDFHTIRI